MKTKQQVIDFLESKVGTTVPCPGRPDLDGQCVTLIKALMEFLGVPDPYKARGHAKTVISTYLKEGIAEQGPGFLSVFSNKNMGGNYGHVWVNAGDGHGTYYEQNGQKALVVTKGRTYNYDNVCNFDKYIKENMPDEYAVIVGKSRQRDELVKAFDYKIGHAVPEELLNAVKKTNDINRKSGIDEGKLKEIISVRDELGLPADVNTHDKLMEAIKALIDQGNNQDGQNSSDKVALPKFYTLEDGSEWERNGLTISTSGEVVANYEEKE